MYAKGEEEIMDNRAHLTKRFTKCEKWKACYWFGEVKRCPNCIDVEYFLTFEKGMDRWHRSEEGLAYAQKILKERMKKDRTNAKRRKDYARKKNKPK